MAAWFTIDEALEKIIEGQVPLIKELKAILDIAD
jgi:predicted NUDIX family NTP pyrophosphohydrolase